MPGSGPSDPQEILIKHSWEVRAYLESGSAGIELEQLREFPNQCCQLASKLLARWLIEEERPDSVWGVSTNRWPANGDQTHFWLEVGEFIVDVTADQFPDFHEKVFVSKDRAWHDRFGHMKRLHPDEFTSWHPQCELGLEYSRMVTVLRGQT